MSCMECLHAHIPSPSPTPSHMPMLSVTTLTSSTNDTHTPSPYRLTNTQYKCQWTTNPESIPTPITQLKVYVITVCLILGNGSFSDHTMGLLYPMLRIFSDHTASLLHQMFQAFHLRGLTAPFLLPQTHINYISLYALNRESFIRRRLKYEFNTHSSTLMMDDHTHAHTLNMLMSLCICNANVTTISHVTCMMHTT